MERAGAAIIWDVATAAFTAARSRGGYCSYCTQATSSLSGRPGLAWAPLSLRLRLLLQSSLRVSSPEGLPLALLKPACQTLGSLWGWNRPLGW